MSSLFVRAVSSAFVATFLCLASAHASTGAIIITEAEADSVVDVPVGTPFEIHLEENASTGASWVVTSVSRALGYPIALEEVDPGEGSIGASHTVGFRWFPEAPLLQPGATVSIRMALMRPWVGGEVFHTLTFTIRLVETAAVVITPDSPDVVDVRKGQDVVVRLPANPSTGYTWKVTATDRSFGWPISERFIDAGEAVGSGGISEFRWSTDTPFVSVGATHRVTLEEARWWASDPIPSNRFSLTLRIVE